MYEYDVRYEIYENECECDVTRRDATLAMLNT